MKLGENQVTQPSQYAIATNLRGCARKTTLRVRIVETRPNGRVRVIAADHRYINVGDRMTLRQDQLTPCD
jgi:hypothetical protein